MKECSIFGRCQLVAALVWLSAGKFTEASSQPVAAWYGAQRDEATARMAPDEMGEATQEGFALNAFVGAADQKVMSVEWRVAARFHSHLKPLRLAAIVTTILLQISPLPSVLEILTARDVMRYDGYPYFAVLAGATQWCVYGAAASVGSGDWTHITMDQANGPGVLLGLFYVAVFLKYVPFVDPRRAALQKCLVLGAILLVGESICFAVFRDRAVWWFGLVGAIGSAQIAVSPYKTLPEVLRTRSTKSWPLELCVMNVVQSLATGGFGFASGDAWVFIPNVIGVIAGAFQLLIWAAFSTDARFAKGRFALKAIEVI